MFFTDRFKDNEESIAPLFNATKAMLPYVNNDKGYVVAFLDELCKTAIERNPEQFKEYADWESESIPGGFYFYPKQNSNNYTISGFKDKFDTKLYGLARTYLALDRL